MMTDTTGHHNPPNAIEEQDKTNGTANMFNHAAEAAAAQEGRSETPTTLAEQGKTASWTVRAADSDRYPV